MLLELAGPGPGAGTREEARALSDDLGGLPLALYAAARYVKSARGSGRVWTGGGGITDFTTYREAVQKRFDSAPGAAAGGPSESLGLEKVHQVFGLSLDLLARRGLPEAAPLLKLLACLGTDPVPYFRLLDVDVLNGTAVLQSFTAEKRSLLLEALADLGLIELENLPDIEDPDLSNVLSLHPVVHGIFRGDEDVRRRRAAYYRLNIELLLAATTGYNPDYPEGWGIWHVLVPHTVEVCRATLLGPTQLDDQRVIAPALELARRTCRYLIVAGIIAPAESLAAEVIDNVPSLGFSLDDREVLALRHEKGRIAIERGDPAAAEAELREVVVGRTRLLGERAPDTLASRHKLAKAMLEQTRWAESEEELASIVEDERHVRGYDHLDTIVVRHSLARAIYAQGKYEAAETMLREIRAAQLRHWPPNTPETLYVQLTLARCLLDQERTEEAQQEVRDALSLIGTRRDVLVVLQLQLRYTRAQVLLRLGERDLAITELRKLLDDRNEMLGSTHPETRRTREFLQVVLAHGPESTE